MRKLGHEEIQRLDPTELADAPRHPVVLLLDNIRSAHNVGSIMRTADAAFIEQVIVSGFTPDPNHRSARKTALGAEETVPWIRSTDPVESVVALRKKGWRIIVLELTDEPGSIRDIDADHFPVCLIAGNEVDGVSEALVAEANQALEIPQFGTKQSLNVSVATGIALFDLVRVYRSMAETTI